MSKVYFGGMALSPPARDSSDMERSPATRPVPQHCQPEWSGFKAALGFRIVFRFTQFCEMGIQDLLLSRDVMKHLNHSEPQFTTPVE